MKISGETYVLSGARVFEIALDGAPLGDDRDATRVMSAALEHDADIVAIPTARLTQTFFDLNTRAAGAFVQKFINYRLRLAFLGDMSAPLAASRALQAYVAESNRGQDVWFVADRIDLERKLSGPVH